MKHGAYMVNLRSTSLYLLSNRAQGIALSLEYVAESVVHTVLDQDRN